MISEPSIAVGRVAQGKNGSTGVIYAIEDDYVILRQGDSYKRVPMSSIVRCFPSELEKGMHFFGLVPIPLPNGCVADPADLQKPTPGSEMRRRLSEHLKNQSSNRS